MTAVRDRQHAAAPDVGLHGHRFDEALVRCAATELFGTWALVLVITSVAVEASLSRPIAGTPYDSLAIPLVAGLALTALAASIGPISGAHLNPAVTIGLAITGRMPRSRLAAYIAAQSAGAVLAALTLWLLQGPDARSDAALGAPGPALGVDIWRLGSSLNGTSRGPAPSRELNERNPPCSKTRSTPNATRPSPRIRPHRV